MHRDVGQDLPVQFDACQLAPVHELRIGQTLGADTGVDTLDPQTTEGPLLNLAVAIRILTSLFDGLARDADGVCLLYTSPSPRDRQKSRMPSSA